MTEQFFFFYQPYPATVGFSIMASARHVFGSYQWNRYIDSGGYDRPNYFTPTRVPPVLRSVMVSARCRAAAIIPGVYIGVCVCTCVYYYYYVQVPPHLASPARFSKKKKKKQRTRREIIKYICIIIIIHTRISGQTLRVRLVRLAFTGCVRT